MAGTPSAVSWVTPIRLFDADRTKRLLSTLPLEAGVYRIRALDANEQPVLLRRVNGNDSEGILGIGETGSDLRWRIKAFQKAVLDGKAYHAAGIKFHNYQYENLFPLGILWVDWVIKANKDAARTCERRLLEEYRRRFLDQPPLNSKA